MSFRDNDNYKHFAYGALTRKPKNQGAGSFIPHVIVQGIEKKSCCICGSLKPLTDFYQSSNKIDGLRHSCKVCEKEKRKTRK